MNEQNMNVLANAVSTFVTPAVSTDDTSETDEQLDALVEAAVQALNAETIKVEAPIVSTDGMGTSTEDK